MATLAARLCGKWAFGICLGIVAASAAHAAAARKTPPPPPTPQQGAGDFFRTYLRDHPSGVPSARVRARLRPFITEHLHGLLEEGEKAETRYAEATRHQNPPLIEGNMFTSLFEGASAFKVGICGQQSETMATCEVQLTYRVGDEGETHWTDTVVLVREERRFRVDDVIYGGSWAFSNMGRLSEILQTAIAESRAPN